MPSPAENVTHTLGEARPLASNGPQGFLGQIQFPDPQGSRRLSLPCTWNGQDSWLVHWWLWKTSTAQAGRNYSRAEFGLLMSDELQELQGVMLLLLLLFFFTHFFFPRFQEHPGKSFRVLYFHLSPGLLWTAEVIVRVKFRDLKGSNLKAFDWKCKLQLESCQVLLDGTWRDAAAKESLQQGNLNVRLPSTASDASKSRTLHLQPHNSTINLSNL